MIRLKGKVGFDPMTGVTIRTLYNPPALHIKWNLAQWKYNFLQTYFQTHLDTLTFLVRVYKIDNKFPHHYSSYIEKLINLNENELIVRVDGNEQYVVNMIAYDQTYFLPFEKSPIITMENQEEVLSTTINWMKNKKSNNWRSHFSAYTYYNISIEED